MIRIDEVEILKLMNSGDFSEVNKFIEKEIKLQLNLNNTEKQAYKAIIALSKKFKKNTVHENIAGAYELEGRTMMSDGFRVFVFEKPIENFPGIHTVECEEAPVNFMTLFPKNYLKLTPAKIDMESLLIQYKNYKAVPAGNKKDCPERIYKITTKDNIVIKFDIQFLLDTHNIMDLETCEIFLGNVSSPMFVLKSGIKSALLPIM